MKARNLVAAVLTLCCATALVAQERAGQPASAAPPAAAAVPGATTVKLPPRYVIGVSDVLTVSFWREKDMSAEVVVRPDGLITLPLLNDLKASGLTPDELREAIVAAASKLVEDPAVTVGVKQINSRKIYISGEVAKPNTYDLAGPTTVMQLIAMAGGVNEYAKKKEIMVLRVESDGTQRAFPFNYEEVSKGRNLASNILLQPNDQVIVP